MKDRIKKLRKTLNLNQEQFAQRIGLARNSIANYEIGRREPSNAIITSICREFKVDYLWLTTGEGEMFSSIDDDVIGMVDEILVGENEFAKSVFKAFAYLDEKDWADLERIIRKVAKEGVKKD